jgi:S-(hydroxymethyl)mycothiol dehydrogenase
VAQKVRGVVAKGKGAPVSIETIVIPDPGPGEAVVAVQACGVCHTDLHYREGGINDEFPFLLGHEAAGVVESVGPASPTSQARRLRDPQLACGVRQLPQLPAGKPWLCFSTFNATQKMTLEDGTVLSPALGIGAFADKTLVAAGQCTKVDPSVPATTAGLLGCGVMAGIGAAINTGNVGRGDSVAVFGCGGVGDAAIAGAPRRGPPRSSPSTSTTGSWPGRSSSAPPTRATRSTTDPVEYIKSVTNGNGADVCIEAIGHPAVYKQAFEARDLAGTVVLVGVPRPDMTLELPFIEVFGRGGQLKSSLVRRLPAVARLPDAGQRCTSRVACLDKFVSETISLDAVEEAFHKMERGEVLRSVVVL